MSRLDLAARAEDEVRALHAFFVAWFRDGSAGTADFVSCERAFAPDFRMVTPDGGSHDRAAVIGRLRAARGTVSGDFVITIHEPHPVWQAENAVLLEFVERQYRDGRTTSRRSVALFTHEAVAPRGVVWRHLQETWIQSGLDEDT